MAAWRRPWLGGGQSDLGHIQMMTGCAHLREPWAAQTDLQSLGPTPRTRVQTDTDMHSQEGGHCAPSSWTAGLPPLPRPPVTHIPALRRWLGHTQSPFSPWTSNTSSVFLLGASPSLASQRASQPGSLAHGRPLRGPLPLRRTGLLSLVTWLLSRPALNGCLFTARRLARCILGSPLPPVPRDSCRHGAATTEGTEPPGPVRLSVLSPSQALV